MINLLNKLLSRFNLKLVSTKPVDFVKETMKFLNTIPPEDFHNDGILSPYVGDITFVTDKTGRTYFRNNFRMEKKGDKYHCDNNGRDQYFCDYDGDPNDPWKKMCEETRFTTEQLQEKLNES